MRQVALWPIVTQYTPYGPARDPMKGTVAAAGTG
jgi:hypothetical protein